MSRLLKFFITAYAPLALHYRLLDTPAGALDVFRTHALRCRASDARLGQRRPPSIARAQPTSLAA